MSVYKYVKGQNDGYEIVHEEERNGVLILYYQGTCEVCSRNITFTSIDIIPRHITLCMGRYPDNLGHNRANWMLCSKDCSNIFGNYCLGYNLNLIVPF